MIFVFRHSPYRHLMAMLLAVTASMAAAACATQEIVPDLAHCPLLVYRAEDGTDLLNPDKLRFSSRNLVVTPIDSGEKIVVRPFASRYKALTDDAILCSLTDAEKYAAHGLWICAIDENCPELQLGPKSLLQLSKLKLLSVAIEFDGFGTLKEFDCDKVLTALGSMPDLNALGIEGTTLSPGHMRLIGEIGGLRHLKLDRCTFSMADDSFRRALNDIRSLSLSYTTASDDDMKVIMSAPLLDRVDISGTEVTASGLRNVGQMPRLKHLCGQDLQVDIDNLSGVTFTPSLVELHIGPRSEYEGYRIQEMMSDNSESEERLERPQFPISDKAFASLSEQCTLESLSLCCAEISDLAARQFVLRHPLHELSFAGCELVGDRCASAIAESRLVRLDMSGTMLTNAGVKEIAKCDTLKHLSLSGTTITSDAIQHLSDSKLVSINLDDTEIDDTAFEPLSNISTLESISLRSTKVTGHGIKILASCRGLTNIDLDFTEVTDDTLSELRTCILLSEIGIMGCKNTTIDGVRQLSKHPAIHLIMIGPRDDVTREVHFQLSHKGRIAIR